LKKATNVAFAPDIFPALSLESRRPDMQAANRFVKDLAARRVWCIKK